MFTQRTSKPGAGNKYYIRKANGGYSTCVQGSPTDKNCNVLANCVGYACGRFNEIIGSMKYPSLNCNAENFIERAKNTYGLEVVSYPVLGGIMVWQKGATLSGNDGAGHVAIVEKIYDSNHIYTSESGYGSSAFWNSHRYNTNGRWGSGSGYKFRGCIVNPAVGKVTASAENKPTTNPTPATKLKFSKGNKIILNGYLYKDAKGNGRGKKLTNHKGTITITANGSKPYHIDSLGWVAESDIRLQSAASTTTYKTVVNCTWLNLRTGTSYGNNIYKAVKKGTKLEYLGVSNGWAKVKYNGKTLYCGKSYLK